jgi:hypothetical protein
MLSNSTTQSSAETLAQSTFDLIHEGKKYPLPQDLLALNKYIVDTCTQLDIFVYQEQDEDEEDLCELLNCGKEAIMSFPITIEDGTRYEYYLNVTLKTSSAPIVSLRFSPIWQTDTISEVPRETATTTEDFLKKLEAVITNIRLFRAYSERYGLQISDLYDSSEFVGYVSSCNHAAPTTKSIQTILQFCKEFDSSIVRSNTPNTPHPDLPK